MRPLSTRLRAKRPGAVLTLVVPALVVLGLMTVFAVELANTQANTKADVETRLHERAVLAAALVDTTFQSLPVNVPGYEAAYGGRVITPSQLDATLGTSAYQAVLDSSGRVLAASTGTTPQTLAQLPRSPAVALVQAGQPYAFGNLARYGATSAVELAIGFHTAYGQRILAIGWPFANVSAPLTANLRKVPPEAGTDTHNYVLDANDAVLGSTNSTRPPGYTFDRPSQIKALRHASGEHDGFYYIQVPLTNSNWRFVVSGPSAALFANVTSNHAWLWLLFAAFGLTAGAALLLGRRVLSSAERAVQEANRASQMKSNFVANMSHEIRTPLNGVVGMLNLLAETSMTAEQREYVDVARLSGDGLMTVINDILDIARVESGRLVIEPQDFDLHDAVEESCEMLSAVATSKGLVLQAFVHDGVPRMVHGDRMRLNQILVNLVANAVKFTIEGEVVVSLSVVQVTNAVVRIRFEVRDTGIGIDPGRVEQMFEAFSQAEASTTREFGGSGLGLAISRELTWLMGGSIGAESELGKGSTFWFELPFALARQGPVTPLRVAGLGGRRVLVVDDNTTNRQIFEGYVKSWGMRASGAADGDQALHQLERETDAGDPFDVVLLDYDMPGENGLELARRIKASPSLSRTRLILLSSSSDVRADSSVVGHLTKPVRQARLLDAICDALGIDRTRAEWKVREQLRAAPATDAPGCRILVAEDQPVNWKLIERLLDKRGHSAVNATDGRAVLEQLHGEHYDLLLMDCQMPELDGYDTAREIRRLEANNGGARIPIVAMTASAMDGDRERCIDAGMDDYLAKPVTPDELDQVLVRWLPEQDRAPVG